MKPIALAFAAGVAALCLSAGMAMADMLTFKANLAAATEVPPSADSKGSGTATFMVDTAAKTVTWDMMSKDLTGQATAAHIHGPAAPGENAGPILDLSANMEKGSAPLTDDLLKAMQDGKTYVNVHTAKYPDGEIRGQLEKQ